MKNLGRARTPREPEQLRMRRKSFGDLANRGAPWRAKARALRSAVNNDLR